MKNKILEIIIIEDNEDHIELVKRCFELINIEANYTAYTDGDDAYEYFCDLLKSNRQFPDIVFLDIKLPKINGIEILNFIYAHRNLSKINIIIMSSSEAVNEKEFEKWKDIYTYIVKPLKSNKIKDVLKLKGIITD